MFGVMLCLLFSASAAPAEKKKAKAPEEKMAYDPPFDVTCFPPVVTKEKLVLRALHPLGYHGKTPTVNEVVLRIEDDGGGKRTVIVSNVNYAANGRGLRTGKELPAGTPMQAFVYRHCLRKLPGNVRALLAGREMDLMVRPR